jgi:hypothetical protein
VSKPYYNSRSGVDGLLKIHSPDNKRELLPHDDKKEGCQIDQVKQDRDNEKCFKAGTQIRLK